MNKHNERRTSSECGKLIGFSGPGLQNERLGESWFCFFLLHKVKLVFELTKDKLWSCLLQLPAQLNPAILKSLIDSCLSVHNLVTREV